MTLTAPDTDELAAHLAVSPDETWLADVLETSLEIIADHLTTTGLAKCPQGVYRTGVLLLAGEIRLRMSHAGGLVQQYGSDGSVVRLSRDAWPSVSWLLGRYVPIGASG